MKIDLESNKIIHLDESKIEEIYCGARYVRPVKVLNPDPNVFYDGTVIDVKANGNRIFTSHIETDTNIRTNKVGSFGLSFDVCDIFSPDALNKKNGRFSFQYEDTTMSKGDHYRRVLFFLANDTKPKIISDYYSKAEVLYIDNLKIRTFLNEKGDPTGFAYFYDRKNGYYYFTNFKDGKLHGFLFKFSANGKNYVFEDIMVYYEGQRTDLYSDYIKQMIEIKNKYELTIISWS